MTRYLRSCVGSSIKRYLHLIDARYPSQLDTGLNTALKSLRAASNSEGKPSRRKRRNSASKRAENGDAMDETANNKPVEEQVLDFISLTFRVRRSPAYVRTHFAGPT